MFTAFIDIPEFRWWWLLAIPMVLLLLAGCYRLMTRVEWFRDRKLTVCIVLSVLAHALLLTGAYMARLFDVPDLGGDGSIRVTWEESTDDNPIPTRAPQSLPTPLASLTALPSMDDTQVDPQGITPPEFATPEFVPTDSGAAEFEPAEFEPPVTAQPAPDTQQADLASSLFPPADSLIEPQTSSNFEPSDAHSLESQSPPFDAPSFETPEFKIPLANEPMAAEAGATQSLEDDPANVPPASADPPPTNDFARHQPSVRWTPPKSAAASDLAKNEMPNDLIPVPRMPPAASTPVNRYQLRFSPDRMEHVRKRGGDADTEAAVAAAQRWLVANQESDGHWDASRHQSGQDLAVDGHYRSGAGREADTGITGLALLCLLGNGNTHDQGDYRHNVGRALEYLMKQQSDDGSLAGNSLYYARTYCHGIATLALSEAYAMTSDERLRPFVQRAVNYTLRTQQAITGGWRYRPGQSGDMSQFGWQVMALVSADQAGIPLQPGDRHLLTTFLRTVSTGHYGGLASYRPNQGPSATMTAEALVCRVFLGQTSDRRRLAEAADYIASQPPSTGPMNLYYWYYGTMAMYQYGDPHWGEWNAGIKRRLLGSQQASGNLAGSWDPNTVWGSYGGRVYSTAMAALCLEVYYRFLPLISEHSVESRP